MRIPSAIIALALLAAPQLAWGERATEMEAERVCQGWLAHIVGSAGHWAGSADPQIREVRELRSGDVLLAYCFMIAPRGHVVVPVLKELPPVKAYSEAGDLDVTERGGFVQLLREMLGHRIGLYLDAYGSLDAAQPARGEVLFGRRHRESWDHLLTAQLPGRDGPQRTEVGPLLTTSWKQSGPYDIYCPMGDGGLCLVGCVATAAAQIMNYHEWPVQGVGHHSYWWNGDDSCGGGTPGATLDAVFSDEYDWANMPDQCASGCTIEEQEAAAELCYEVGVAFEMDYGHCASGAYTSDALFILPTYFNYDSSIDQEFRSSHTAASWFAVIQEQINLGHPMLYAFLYSEDSGHAIVCDGWRDSDGEMQYHMNYGWGGGWNGWFTIDELYHSLDPQQEHLIRNIRLPTTLEFACCIGETCQLLNLNDCTSAGGTWLERIESCDPNPCTTYACCVEDACDVRREWECVIAGGDWLEGVETCDPDPCLLREYACCIEQACHLATEADCADAGGEWQEQVASCTPNPCMPRYACCLGEDCLVLTEEECGLAGGDVQADLELCSPNPCTSYYACCIGEVCQLLTQWNCAQAGGEWQLGVDSCDPNPCVPGGPDYLQDGVFIVHAPPGIEFTDEQDWCQRYVDEFAISGSGEQVNRIDPDVASEEISVWYVVAAWNEPKDVCLVSFGLGTYDPSIFGFLEWGPCNGGGLETSTLDWPGSGEGTTLFHADQWSGDCVPVYYFAGYGYAEGQIPLGIDPGQEFGGFGNCVLPQETSDAACFGTLGILTDGSACHPPFDTGACCVEDDCSLTDESACADLGGEWHVEWQACDPNPCASTAVEEIPLRTGALLGTPRPNPFTGTTHLRYQVVHAGPVDIAVYDPTGRRVRALAGRDGWVEWDGRDDHGAPVAPGAYFCRLRTGGGVAAQRIIYLK